MLGCFSACCVWQLLSLLLVLVLQAGKQLEWLTGGRVKAGMHEVRWGSSSRFLGAGGMLNCAQAWKLHST